MEMIAHDPKRAKQLGIKQSVGQDFVAADKGKKFAIGGMPQAINKQKTHHTDGGVPNFSVKKYAGLKGGGMAKSDMKEDTAMDKKQDVAMIKKAFKEHDTQEHKGGKGTKLTLKKGGCVSMCRGGGIETKGKTKGRVC